MNRRSFIKSTGIASLGLGLKIDKTYSNNSLSNFPIVIATWDVKNATKRAWEILSSGGNSLDAIEQGCRVEEANKEGQSVGIGDFQTEKEMLLLMLALWIIMEIVAL